MIQMVLLFLPQTLRRAMITSDAYRASWIFHATPANRAELVLAARNIITLAFLVPYLACLAVLFGFAFRDPLHAALHAAFIGLLSFLVLQFTIMVSPQLPFALPIDKEANSGRMFALLIGTTIVGLIMYWALTAVVYKSAIAMVATAAAFVVASWWMDRVTRRRVAKVTTDAGYAG
jgi:FtsH-binding integral membrane protein